MMAVKSARLTILGLVLCSCILCGGLVAGIRPALAALSPLAEETCSASWAVTRGRSEVTLSVKLDCSGLIRLRPINRLYLNPVDRKW
jgi:hypothetical protein